MERKTVKKVLDEELQHVTFTLEEKILAEVRRPTFSEKLSALLNKEVDIPLLPVGAMAVLFFSWGIINQVPDEKRYNLQTDELIEAGGNVYRKDLYEGATINREN
ncbi:hypothetical protein GJU40_18220 [Bacillus lacus]|uniref:Uncharacterized protein n=1 Tax=Metabacillus lacus TaxID=1983721 RepID=A0A7X2M119_9BACI|nr:hypothetical protein [Metabacillus lacus]MRX74062.1 hypothetical protein [Metabacillus lacus]